MNAMNATNVGNLQDFPSLTVLKCTPIGVKFHECSKYGKAFMDHLSLDNHISSCLDTNPISVMNVDKLATVSRI